MKKIFLIFPVLAFFSFNLEDHIVPNTERTNPGANQGQYGSSYDSNYYSPGYGYSNYYSPGSYGTFPNDVQSNNPFDDPNWPNVNRNDRYNNRPGDSYYNSPAGRNPMNRP